MPSATESIEIVEGGLYASRQTDGSFRIVKVLVADEHAVHLRMYAERYEEMPTSIQSSLLSLGSIFGGTIGIGHYPIARNGFFASEKLHLATEVVTEDELEGYRIWLGDSDHA